MAPGVYSIVPAQLRDPLLCRTDDLESVKTLVARGVAATNQQYWLDGPAVAKARHRRDWKQLELAHRAGVSVPTIKNYERPEGWPADPKNAERLATALGVELRDITKNAKDTPSGQTITVIWGFPGVGKTTLVTALVHDLEIRRSFPNGILWASLGQDRNPLHELVRWSEALGVRCAADEKLDVAQRIVAGRLRELRMLLVIDDVWKIPDALSMLVGGPECSTLITTRLREVYDGFNRPNEAQFLLEVLRNEDSLLFLEHFAQGALNGEHEEALLLAAEMEGLPLALKVAGLLLHHQSKARNAMSLPALLTYLRDVRNILPKPIPDEVTPRSVNAVFQLSTDILDAPVRKAFAFLAPFAPKPAYFDVSDLSAVWDVDERSAIDLAETLVGRGLLDNRGEFYWLHALLKAHAEWILHSAKPQ